MRFHNVCLESFGYVLPEEVVTSEQIEQRLSPLYRRLKLPFGRLELISGIQQRRVWQADFTPSQLSIRSCELALAAAGIDRSLVGALVHGSVCRDFLEPATACSVHHRLDLPTQCVIYDISNACLGLLNGILQTAQMIELGQTKAALVVGSEGSRPLMETTIDFLNRETALTRATIKSSIASLTIGSASCAVLLTHSSISRTDNQLEYATVVANTRHHQLCHSGADEAAIGMHPLMDTDSEQLMKEGIATGVKTFDQFLAQSKWTRGQIDRTFCHQVGATHRKLTLDAIGLDESRDFVTYPWLGNTGSVALPITMAIGLESEPTRCEQQVAMMGIGSGINCIIIGVRCRKTLCQSAGESRGKADRHAVTGQPAGRGAD